MSVILKKPYFGGLTLYDMRSVVNVSALRPEFHKLTLDHTMATSGYYKNILKVQKESNGFAKLPITPHKHKEFVCSNVATLERILDIYSSVSGIEENTIVQVEAQRVYGENDFKAIRYIDNWGKHNSGKVAILCIDHENIQSVATEFLCDDNKKDTFKIELTPGFMVIYDSDTILTRTPQACVGNLVDNDSYYDTIKLFIP